MVIKKDLTPVNFTTGRGGQIKALLIHSMWGTQKGSIQWFKNPQAQASSHYNISAEGEIVQTVLDKDTAWHGGVYDKGREPDWAKGVNPNSYTIGIELEDKRDRNWKYPQKQREALIWLVNKLSDKYNIKKDADHILLHRNLNPSRRSDPVGDFDISWVLDSNNMGQTPELKACHVAFEKVMGELTQVKKEFDKYKSETQATIDDLTRERNAAQTEAKEHKAAHHSLLKDLSVLLKTTQNVPQIVSEVEKLIDLEDESRGAIDSLREETLKWDHTRRDMENEIAKLKIQLDSKDFSDQDLERIVKALIKKIAKLIKEPYGL